MAYLPKVLVVSLVSSLALACAGGHDGGAAGGAYGARQPDDRSGARAVAEADIIQMAGGRLYAMSRAGTVSVVDVSAPGRLSLLGQTILAGAPFEMYRSGRYLITMANGAVAPDGSERRAAPWRQGEDLGGGAELVALDVSDPAHMTVVASWAIPGEIADSRVVGDVLYLVTHEDAACYRCGAAQRTLVSSFLLAEPEILRPAEQLSFVAADTGAWGGVWRRSIFATDQHLYIGGHADGAPGAAAGEGIIDVVDISDPAGRLRPGPRVHVAGPVLTRWQMDEHAGVLRVVSQRGAGRVAAGTAAPEVETFAADGAGFAPLGHLDLRLPRQEGLRAVRFDGSRAYAITFVRTDPLFVLDLSDPRYPAQRGELALPGFMFHLEPRGNRLIGLGVDSRDPDGSLNVSLFDVGDVQAPRLISRVSFGPARAWSEDQVVSAELAEDQDRIAKAFRVFDDGLVVVPFTALGGGADGTSCANGGGGVQLVEYWNDTLTKRALLPLPGNPRRAVENRAELLTVSDSHVRAFSLRRIDVALQTAELIIGDCSEIPQNLHETPWADDPGRDMACSYGGRGRASAPAALALLGLALVRRRRRLSPVVKCGPGR